MNRWVLLILVALPVWADSEVVVKEVVLSQCYKDPLYSPDLVYTTLTERGRWVATYPHAYVTNAKVKIITYDSLNNLLKDEVVDKQLPAIHEFQVGPRYFEEQAVAEVSRMARKTICARRKSLQCPGEDTFCELPKPKP